MNGLNKKLLIVQKTKRTIRISSIKKTVGLITNKFLIFPKKSVILKLYLNNLIVKRFSFHSVEKIGKNLRKTAELWLKFVFE